MVARVFPLVCGCDLAGTVAEPASADWKPGDEVVVTGWGLADTAHGGYSQRQRVPADWLVSRPQGLTLRQTMAVATAGLTAMLAVLALEDAGITSADEGPVLVTGASGGVGSVAVAVLARLGYRVTASTGRPEQAEFLRTLGATDIVDRAELAVEGRPLDIERWAATVDSVGSTTLATAIRQTHYRGAVLACGLAGGRDLPITVMPFILSGVRLLGVHSVRCPTPERTRAWWRPLERVECIILAWVGGARSPTVGRRGSAPPVPCIGPRWQRSTRG